jgi:hypothetical protein
MKLTSFHSSSIIFNIFNKTSLLSYEIVTHHIMELKKKGT